MKNIKTNFIVSGSNAFWKSELNTCHVSNPLLKLKYNNYLNNLFNKVEYFENTRKTGQDLKYDSDFVDLKYKKYIKILTERLNHIHHKNYSKFFWSKALSIGFLRQINILYDHFKIYEKYFDRKKHYVNILSNKDFDVPIDYEECRNIISDDLIGSEQVFSVYMNLFFKKNIDKRISHKSRVKKKKQTLANYFFLRILKIKRFIISGRKSSVVTGILGSYFDKENKKRLIKSNKGKIDEIFIYPKTIKKDYLDNEMRNTISFIEKEFDRFDSFFFEAQKFLFPKFFLENFDRNEKHVLIKLKSYNKLKILLSENWIIEPINSLTLALAKENYGIIHINNEHNCISHIYQGRYLEYIVNLSDKFYNIGWETDNTNIVKSSSLYNFRIPKRKTKYDILFVSAPIQYKMKYFSSFEVYSQENAVSTINFNNQFFESLGDELLRNIFYKKYPINYYVEKEKFYLKSFNKVNLSLSNSKFNAFNFMSQSRLVIIDYVSTSYLESIISNIPTIVFYNKSSIRLKKEHNQFFNTLIDSGIFQTNPNDASELIRKIYRDPMNWWTSNKVQRGRKVFLDQNLGDPETFINQMTKMASIQ